MSQDIYVVIEHLRGKVSEISYIMVAAGRVLSDQTGGSLVGIVLGYESQDIANNLAVDRVLYVNHPALKDFSSDAYQKVLASLINENDPRVALFGNTTIGADLSSVLSIRLQLPLISSCQQVSAEGKLFSQICGGKIMAESTLPDGIVLVSVIPGGFKPEEGQSNTPPEITPIAAPGLEDLRVNLRKYIEPEISDVDISKEPILIAIGRGIQTQDNIELAEELANIIGGVVCASRPIVDQGWLPTSRMVGKSGQRVKAKLYLALGISGAPEHIEGMSDSETIIAINTDPAAPIYDIAKYGVEVDMFDLFDELIEQVQAAKG